METGVCLSRPFELFISSEVISERDLEGEEVVSVSIEEEEQDIFVPVNSADEFDIAQESIATFDILPRISDKFSNELENILDPGYISDDGPIDINGPEQMESYLGNINKITNDRIDEKDIIVGIEILDILTEYSRIEFEDDVRIGFIEGNLFSAPNRLVLDSLLNTKFNIEIGPIEEEIREPDELVFCTHMQALPENVYENMRELLENVGYITSMHNYLIPSPAGTFHGPLRKNGVDEKQVMKLTKENIEFNPIKWATLNIDDEDFSIDSECLHTLIEENVDCNNISKEEQYDRVRVEFDSYYAEIAIRDEIIQIHIAHALEDQVTEFENRIRDLIPALEEELDTNVNLSNIHTHTYESPLLEDKWVLDTNTLYKQSPHSDSTDISNFILENKNIYNTEIHIPWQVICEINKHKEESTSKKRISKQGIDNLETLKLVSDFGYIDLHIEQAPDTIDNSIIPDTGATDTGILSYVPDDATLLTNDQRLKKLAEVCETKVYDVVSETSQDTTKSDIWEEVETKLENDQTLFSEFIEFVDDIVSTREFSGIENKPPNPESLVKEWVRNNHIVQYYDEGEKYVSLSQKFEVVPTYKMVREVIDNVKKHNSEHLFTKDFLEELRRELGRLPQNKLPVVSFIIPEQFVYRASEVDQLEELLKLSNVDNCHYKSISVSVDQSALQTELNEAVIKAAQMEEAIVLCNSEEHDLSMTSILIDVEVIEY